MMLLSAARNGDQEAMESLTLDDIDTYSKVSKRLITEDIFTIVETYFMPYGVECDEYSILVRDFSYAPGLADCLRITVGTPQENDEVLAAFAALVKEEM